jgi:hypothetical protein
MTTPASGLGGDDNELIWSGANGLTHVPFLGYRLRESHLDTASTQPYIRAPQRWIAWARTTVEIDVFTFDRYQPFAQLLEQDSTSELITSTPEALASFPCDEVTRHRYPPTGLTVHVRGRDFQALVCDSNIHICASRTVATALKLLMDDFSPQIRASTVKGENDLLEAALAVFRPEIRQRYIPRANEYVTIADREVAEARQDQLRERVAKRKRNQGTSPALGPTTDPPAGSV